MPHSGEPETSASAPVADWPAIGLLIRESRELDIAGRVGPAFARAHEALVQARAGGDPDAIAMALAAVAWMHFRLGHYDRARAFASEALERASAEAVARAEALIALAGCAAETDDLHAAEELLRGALDLGRQLGSPWVLYRALHGLAAVVYWPRGQFDLALAADEEASHIAAQASMSAITYGALIITADVNLKLGERARARATLEQLRQIAVPDSAPEGYFHCLSGHLAQDEGELERALTLYARARAIADVVGEPWLLVESRRSLSCGHRAAGRLPEARAWADDAVGTAARLGYRHAHGIALVERARVAWGTRDLAAAESDLRAAVELLTPLRAAFDLADAQLLLAALLLEQQRAGATEAWLLAGRAILAGGYVHLLERERDLALPLVLGHLHGADAELRRVSQALLERLSQVPPPPLRIVTLGRFEVQQGARWVSGQAWRQRRAGELFRLLLVSPQRSLSCEQAMETLWPERAAAAAFHQATSAIRRALEPELPDRFPSRYLHVEGGRISLRLPSGSAVDFETFEQRVRAGEWAAAATLYSGDLFPEDLLAEWSAGPRRRLAELHVRALRALAEERLRAGRFQEALELCRRVLALDVWQEMACLLGMRACLALGDRPAAIRLYQGLALALQADLGIAPLPDLQALYHSILG